LMPILANASQRAPKLRPSLKRDAHLAGRTLMQAVEPDLIFGGFSLWVLGRQFPNAEDYWDGNWLYVRARVEAPGASVEAQGAIVHTSELAAFAEQLESLHVNLVGEAALRCMEPNLQIAIRGDALGHTAVQIMITPDNMTQTHEFKFDLDQTYVGPLLNGCRNLLTRWPVRAVTSAPGQTRPSDHVHRTTALALIGGSGLISS